MIATLALALALAAPPAPVPPPAPPVFAARSGRDARLLGEWPSKPSDAKVTLSDGKMSVDKALRKIASAAGWSMVANTGRAGDRLLVLDLRGVPAEDALVAVLDGSTLAATRRGDTITVAPQTAPVAETPVLAGFETPSGKKVTASFTDAPVDKALRQIAEAAGWSIVLPPGLRGAVNASFRATPAEEALKAVLSQAGLSATRDGSVVTVARDSGPRVVVRGNKRQLVFDTGGGSVAVPSPEEIRALTDEARQAAADAARDAEAEIQGPGEELGGKGRKDKVVAGDITIGAGERWRDVVAIRGSVHMGAGSSARQVTAVLGSVELEPGATVEQEVVAVGGNVHVSPGARVGNDAVSVGGEVVIDPGGTVEGQEVSVSVPGFASLLGLASSSSPVSKSISPLLKVGHALAKYVVFFLLGLLLLAVAPARLDRVTASLSRSPVRDVLVGLLGTVAMPVLTLLLVVTIVGILLIPVQLIAILMAAILGYTALALLIGRALPFHPEKGTAVIQLAIGTAVVVALSEIPFVGVMAMVSAWFLVFGAVLRSRGGQAEPGQPVQTTTIATTTGP
jgi:hypothetical protein